MRAVVTALIMSLGVSTCALAQSGDGPTFVGDSWQAPQHVHRHGAPRWNEYRNFESHVPAPSTGTLNYDGYPVHDDGGFQPGDANGS